MSQRGREKASSYLLKQWHNWTGTFLFQDNGKTSSRDWLAGEERLIWAPFHHLAAAALLQVPQPLGASVSSSAEWASLFRPCRVVTPIEIRYLAWLRCLAVLSRMPALISYSYYCPHPHLRKSQWKSRGRREGGSPGPPPKLSAAPDVKSQVPLKPMTGVPAAVPDVLATCTSRSGPWDPCPITPISSEILSRLLSTAQEGRLAWSSASPSLRPWVPEVPECVCTLLPITCTNSIRKHLSTPSLFTFKGLNSLFTGLSTIPGPNGEESPVQFCAAWSLVFAGLFLSLSCNIHDNRVGLFFFFPGLCGAQSEGPL